MAMVVEVPPEGCQACGERRLRPGWGECPEPTCREMGRIYECPRWHVTVAPWHVHRAVPSIRPRWVCTFEEAAGREPR